MQQWIDWLDKLTGPIRRQGVEETLRELKDIETAALTTARVAEATGTGRKKLQRDKEKEENSI